MIKRCAFTGHRDLGGKFDYNLLDRGILNLVKSGVTEFYCGMAVGFDMAAAECVLACKNEYDVKLCACIPCPEQIKNYGSADKFRYERILKRCDEIIVLSENYYKGCMLARDRFMVDNCDVLLSYLRKDSGGTFYTVNYAERKNVKIISI